MNNERLFHASEMLVISREISVFVYEEITARGEGTLATKNRAERWSDVVGRGPGDFGRTEYKSSVSVP